MSDSLFNFLCVFFDVQCFLDVNHHRPYTRYGFTRKELSEGYLHQGFAPTGEAGSSFRLYEALDVSRVLKQVQRKP